MDCPGEKIMILDEEVFAVLMAVVIIGSVLGIVNIIHISSGESFTAIGLLNEDCKIGIYPKQALENTNITLCIYVYNHMGRPVYYKVVYKIGGEKDLPTNTSPSLMPEVMSWRGVLDNDENHTFKILIPIPSYEKSFDNKTALIFELWIYDTSSDKWVYTGERVHLYIQVLKRS
jgi:uncharacterized membrane protein